MESLDCIEAKIEFLVSLNNEQITSIFSNVLKEINYDIINY